jgi:hypothetical protein
MGANSRDNTAWNLSRSPQKPDFRSRRRPPALLIDDDLPAHLATMTPAQRSLPIGFAGYLLAIWPI